MVKVSLEEGVYLPKKETKFSSGADIIANSVKKIYIGIKEVDGDRLEKIQQDFQERGFIKMRAHERVLFGTGVNVLDMSPLTEIQVRNRSGVSLKKGLIVANSPGTVDADYRGEIGVILLNTNPFLTRVDRGDRIAQAVVCDVSDDTIQLGTISTETERGSGGFGSTGVN